MKDIMKWKTKTAKKKYLADLIENQKQKATFYKKENNLKFGDYVEHFKFGFGFIQKVISNTKVEVFFENSEKNSVWSDKKSPVKTGLYIKLVHPRGDEPSLLKAQ